MGTLVQQGEEIDIKVRFLQADGITTLPVAGVTFHCRQGDGAILLSPPVPAEITEDGVTKWKVTLTPDVPGIWQFEMRTTTPARIEIGSFVVGPSI